MIRLLLASLLATTVGCTARSAPAPSTFTGTAPLQITCTVGMLGDIVKRIGGERVELTTLMGPGTDPHLYRAVPSDRKKLEQSDLVLYCGLHLEGNLGPTFDAFRSRVRTVAICEKLDPSVLLSEEGTADSYDPHLWFDVSLWSSVAQLVCDELCEFDRAGASEYTARTKALRTELAALHQYVTEQVQTIAEGQRVMITAHDAFRYFGRAYGIEVMGIQGLSTADEAGVRRIGELVEFIVERKISAVFVESTISEDNVRALIEGCKARNHALRIGGELFSDAMGAKDSAEGTYVGMIRNNVNTLVQALRRSS